MAARAIKQIKNDVDVTSTKKIQSKKMNSNTDEIKLTEEDADDNKAPIYGKN
jgi:hypothetical protein